MMDFVPATDREIALAEELNQALRENNSLRGALIEARAAIVLRSWDEHTLIQIDAALESNLDRSVSRN